MVAVHAGIENWSLCKKLCKSSFIFDVLQSFFFFFACFYDFVAISDAVFSRTMNELLILCPRDAFP